MKKEKKFNLSSWICEGSLSNGVFISPDKVKEFLEKDEKNIRDLRMGLICWKEYFEKRDKLLGSKLK